MTTFDYIKAIRVPPLGIERDVDSYDFHVQIVDLMQSKDGSQARVISFVALYSPSQDRTVQSRLVVLGETTKHCDIMPLRSLAESLQLIMHNGATRMVIPLNNHRQMLEIPLNILEHVGPIFDSEPLATALRALGISGSS